MDIPFFLGKEDRYCCYYTVCNKSNSHPQCYVFLMQQCFFLVKAFSNG